MPPLSISRSSLYHRPKGESPQNRGLMRRIDELFPRYPFYGSRQMVRHLWGWRLYRLSPGSASDAVDGATGHLPSAAHYHPASRAPGLPLSFEGVCH